MDKDLFGPFLAEERKKRNMTQGQLADKVHVSTAAVSKWERCLCLPDLAKLEDIADVLDLSLIELMQCKRNPDDVLSYKVDDVQTVLHSTVMLSENEIKKSRKKILSLKACLCLILAAALFLGYLLYSKPMTLSQLYPMIKMEDCAEIKGFYGIGSLMDSTEFSFDRSSEEFWKLLMLFDRQEYRRSLKNILPRGTKIHQIEGSNDIWWDVHLRFENLTMPDGSISSGSLRFHNWYGELEIFFDSESYICFPKERGLFDSVFALLKGK